MIAPDRFGCVVNRTIVVIVNRDGGTASAAGDSLTPQIEAAFEAAGLRADVRLIAGEAVAAAMGEVGDELIVVGGGDGTIGCAADALVAAGRGWLGILPLGTRNHFARELGIPMDLAGAARIVAAGAARRVDLAQVNGFGFVNNASIGLYPYVVRRRAAGRKRHGLPKWLATLIAASGALRRLRHHRLRLIFDGAAQPLVTPLLFVGNNRYTLEGGRVGQRLALDDGTLSVFAVAAGHRLKLVWFALRTLVGRSDPNRDFALVGECDHFRVEAHADHIDVALDGEVQRLGTPLLFQLLAGALTVVAPPVPES